LRERLESWEGRPKVLEREIRRLRGGEELGELRLREMLELSRKNQYCVELARKEWESWALASSTSWHLHGVVQGVGVTTAPPYGWNLAFAQLQVFTPRAGSNPIKILPVSSGNQVIGCTGFDE
jgi:hypothetical protein